MTNDEKNDTTEGSFSLVHGHIPKSEEVQFNIGPYQVLSSIGKGGMGEVFLAYDTLCGRRIALKRIRPDLLDFKQINYRFLKEAHITCQLTHPSIIPIYAIHKEGKEVYYTMPFVQGETLKEILKKGVQKAKREFRKDGLTDSDIEEVIDFDFEDDFLIFWDTDKNGKLSLNDYKFKLFLENRGFYKVQLNEKEFTFVKVYNNVINEVNEIHIKDFVLNYFINLRIFG